MVHKKSEYTLQFHVLPNDLRKQIWQENIKFRLKYGDLATPCETENVQRVSTTKQNKENLSDEYKATFKNIAVQTTEPPAIVHLEKNSNNEKYSSEASVASESEQTESKHKKLLKKLEVIRADSVPASPETNKSTKLLKGQQMSPLKGGALKGARQLRPSSAKQLRPSSALQLRPSCTRQVRASSASLVDPSSVCSRTSSASTFRRPRSPSPRFSVLSRTSRRSHMEQPRSTFTAYGWNDTKKNVGDKKTYNVLAPQPEVYPLALQAMRHRQAEIEEYLAQENQILNADQTKMNAINHSSIWMSEYKDKFSRPPSVKRPLSSPARRSIVWTVS